MQGLVKNQKRVGFEHEAAFAAALLGDNALMEKSWQDTGMLAETVPHAHVHGRTTLMNIAYGVKLIIRIRPLRADRDNGVLRLTMACKAGRQVLGQRPEC
ncbi:hypothetical protein Tco_0984201, partial [Tanacetum coccineum]